MKKIRKKFIVIIFLGILLSQFALTACIVPGGRSQSHIYDFYGEYRFDLPFAHSRTFMTSSLFFDSEYNMTQMRDLIIEAGYGARLYNFNDIERLHIYAARDGRRYYFMITRLEGSAGRFMIDGSTAMISAGGNFGGIYVFLFPNHLIDGDLWTTETSKRMNGTFEEFADFYTSTGRDNVTVNYSERTITYRCKGQETLSWNQGYVVILWNQTENGNHVIIRPKV